MHLELYLTVGTVISVKVISWDLNYPCSRSLLRKLQLFVTPEL